MLLARLDDIPFAYVLPIMLCHCLHLVNLPALIKTQYKLDYYRSPLKLERVFTSSIFDATLVVICSLLWNIATLNSDFGL